MSWFKNEARREHTRMPVTDVEAKTIEATAPVTTRPAADARIDDATTAKVRREEARGDDIRREELRREENLRRVEARRTEAHRFEAPRDDTPRDDARHHAQAPRDDDDTVRHVPIRDAATESTDYLRAARDATESDEALTEPPTEHRSNVLEPHKAPPHDDERQLAALFRPEVAQDLRARWDSAQIGFVDDPHKAVKQADELVSEVLKTLEKSFADERRQLEMQMNATASTENLRVALQRYRSFFQRLLAL